MSKVKISERWKLFFFIQHIGMNPRSFGVSLGEKDSTISGLFRFMSVDSLPDHLKKAINDNYKEYRMYQPTQDEINSIGSDKLKQRVSQNHVKRAAILEKEVIGLRAVVQNQASALFNITEDARKEKEKLQKKINELQRKINELEK